VGRFYEGASSIFVEAYDAFYQHANPQIAGDVGFYTDIARATGGAVLEVACGTGRITLPMGDAGLEITGVDLSEAMLAVARRKMAACPTETQGRIQLVRQDMTTLNLGKRFGFAFVPFRSFQHLLSGGDQRKTLKAIHGHLDPGGRLALHLFDPRLDLLLDGGDPIPKSHGRNKATGQRYVGEVVRTDFDHLAQIRRDLWRYTEIDDNGTILREETREMALRWTYRWELYHLLALSGFAVDAEYSDFKRSPPAYGEELIVVCRAG